MHSAVNYLSNIKYFKIISWTIGCCLFVVFFFFFYLSAASLSISLKPPFKGQYAALIGPSVGWFMDYFCINSLIPTFVLFVSEIVSLMEMIISFVLEATTMQWECSLFCIRWIPFKYLPFYLFLALTFFLKKHPHLSEDILNTTQSSERADGDRVIFKCL